MISQTKSCRIRSESNPQNWRTKSTQFWELQKGQNSKAGTALDKILFRIWYLCWNLTKWGDSRQSESPAVISAHAERLPHFLETCRQNGADFAIIDTAPHAQNDALAAARLADFILIPCRPSIVDLRAIEATADIARLAGKPACVVLSQTKSRSPLTQEAAEAVANAGVPLAPIHIGDRVAFVYAYTTGLGVQEYDPKGQAAEEIEALFAYIQTQLRKQNNDQESQSRRRSA
jgi:chromosome partitioning protein